MRRFGSRVIGKEGKYAGKEINAATAPPSVFAEHYGEPVIGHDHPEDDRAGRHSNKLADDLRKYGNGIE